MITKEEVFEGDYSHFDVLMLLERIAELDKERAVRDLEQQAKGLTDYAKTQEQGMVAVWIISAASKLLEQAEALKEQE
jgi:hypothetical protein